MANLKSNTEWSDVYQLEKNDPALAGPGGVMNRQAQSLLNRTEYLKANKADNAALVAEVKRSKSVEENLQRQITTSTAGIKYFATLAQLNAFTPGETDPKQAYVFETKKNYIWDGAWQDEGLSAVDQAINFTETTLGTHSQINSLLPATAFQQKNTFFYNKGDGKVTKETNQDLFSVQVSVTEGEYFILNTQRFGVVPAFLIGDADNNIVNLAEILASSETLMQSYVIKIPKNAIKLYVNCTNTYASGFSFSKISKAEIDLLYDTTRQEFMFYQNSNGIFVHVPHHEFFAKQYDVVQNELYIINTKVFGNASEYIVIDASNNILEYRAASNGTFGAYTIKIPANGVKLYVNCSYDYVKKFNVEKLSNKDLTMIPKDGVRQDFVFYYEPNGSLVKLMHDDFFSVQLIVKQDQCFSVKTGTFGIANEYLITDANGNVIEKKISTDTLNDYTIKIPANGVKLYVNCSYAYSSSFSITEISKYIVDAISKNMGVRSIFPTLSYFDKLRLKCPNFYKKFKDKNQDVTVVLTGTSLTQGNLYTTDRADATTRPAALHTHDLASSVFDKLITHWDGQKYRRYDHNDIFYSNSAWGVTTEADDWDDHTYIKNGLTKTTTDANASVSTIIPANAWQFNFVYRSNTNGCDSKIEITQGINYVEVFNGTKWVEAHNYQFSNFESATTSTKGNTQYQKRLKMRCKNKAGGVNSIGTEKQILIKKVSATGRFNVVGFEWSPREFMLSVINGARGGHEWGNPDGNRLERYQDSDIWSFNPDLLLAEITIINWAASEPASMSKDPLYYVNIAKRAYFNEFNDMSDSLFAKSEGYTKCDVIFYSDTIACTPALSGAWDSITHEPLFGTVTTAATNGAMIDNINVGRTKTNFENHEAVECYIASKDYLFIPVLSTFKSVAEQYYGSYWQGMQASDKTGDTLSYDAVHFNDNGSALFSVLIASVFDAI